MGSLFRRYSSYKKARHKKKLRENELRQFIGYLNLQNKTLKKPDIPYSKKLKDFNNQYLGGYKRTKWNQFFVEVTGIESEKFIPLDLFSNFIEPQLNNVAQIPAYEDKNIYDHVFCDFNRPETILRYSYGHFLDCTFSPVSIQDAEKIYLQSSGDHFVKPSWRGTGQGRSVKKFTNTEFKDLYDHIKKSNQNFIVQEYFKQNSVLHNLYPGSVNTLKIMTARIDNHIEFLCSRFRVGRQGSVVDEGGYFLGVNEDGTLNPYALDTELNQYRHHENTGVSFEEVEVPGYREAISICKKMHERLLHFDLVSWDIAIDQNSKPVLIELNISSQGILYLQIVNGPLFGRFTESILSKIKYNLLVHV